MKNFKTLYIASILMFSCNNKKLNDDDLLLEKKTVVFDKYYGSYINLENHYFEKGNVFSYEILPYSLVMSRDSSCMGCYEFYYNFLKVSFNGEFNKENIHRLEKPERDLLLYYLKKGTAKKNEYCKTALLEYYKSLEKMKK